MARAAVDRYGAHAPEDRPLGAAALLRRSLLVYGVGGIVAPFIGIKLIDIGLTAVGVF